MVGCLPEGLTPGIFLIHGLLGSLETFADTVGASVLTLCHGVKSLDRVPRWRRCPVAQMPSATHKDPQFHLSSFALDADWGWKSLNVEISALRSIIKPLESFSHKRGSCHGWIYD